MTIYVDFIMAINSLPKLKQFGYELAAYLEGEIAEKNIKDHRYYIVLEIDPNIQDSELEIPSEAVNELVQSFRKPLAPEEAEDVAKRELMDNIGVIVSILTSMGFGVTRLGKSEILEMAYSALNRDLAPITDFKGFIAASSIQTVSETKLLIDGDREAKAKKRRGKVAKATQDKTEEKGT